MEWIDSLCPQVVSVWLLAVANLVVSFPNNLDLNARPQPTSSQTKLWMIPSSGTPATWKGLPAEWTPALSNSRREIFETSNLKNAKKVELPATKKRKRSLESLLFPYIPRPVFVQGIRRRPVRRRGRRPIYGRPFYYFSPTYGYSISPYYDSYDFASGYADDFDYAHDYAIDYGYESPYIEYDSYGDYSDFDVNSYGDYGDYGGGYYDDYGGGSYGDYGDFDWGNLL